MGFRIQNHFFPRQGTFAAILEGVSIFHRSRRVGDFSNKFSRSDAFVRLVGSSGRASRLAVEYSDRGYGRGSNVRLIVDLGWFGGGPQVEGLSGFRSW